MNECQPRDAAATGHWALGFGRMLTGAVLCCGMSQPTPTLPGVSWTEDMYLRTADDRKLRRWGSVQQACQVLDGCDREVIYDLIAVKAVRGYKLRPHASNSHFKVDLLSVWEHKQRQMSA
jgi:hypothetical protein